MRVEPGEGPRSARVYPMSRQFSGQAAGLRLFSVRSARPTLSNNSPVYHPVRASPSLGTKTCRLIFLFTGLQEMDPAMALA